ncbi:gliding motility-associated C-terminal domain-containing protein, partial [Fulvivirga sediminis]
GTYEITVTDNDTGCTGFASINVNSNPGVGIALSSSNGPSSCGASDGSITLSFTNVPDGIYTINYAAGAFNNVTVTSSEATISGLPAGVYNDLSITVGACTSTQDVDVNLSDPVNFTLNVAGGNITTCGGNEGFVNLTITGGSGNFTYSWVGPNGFASTTEDIASLDEPGTYTVFVNDINSGCSAAATYTVTEPSGCSGGGGECATVRITPNTTPATCTNSDGSIYFDISPSTPLVNNTGVIISISGPESRTNVNDPQFNNLPIGIYDFEIQYGDISCVKKGQVTIDQSGTVGVPVATNVVGAACFGDEGTMNLDVPGETGNVLQWSLDGFNWTSFVAGGQISVPVGPAPTFEQVIAVRRSAADPCNASITVVIGNQHNEIQFTSTSHPVSDCENSDGYITIESIPTGGSNPSGQWEVAVTNGVTPSSYGTLQVGSPVFGAESLSPGNYTLFVRDESGCVVSEDVEITAPGQVNIEDVATNSPSCAKGGKNGYIKFKVGNRGAVPGPYVLIVTSGSDESEIFYQDNDYDGREVEISNLIAGVYNVTIDPANSQYCPNKKSYTLGGQKAVSFEYELGCSGDSDFTRSLELYNVKGEPDLDYKLRILDSRGDEQDNWIFRVNSTTGQPSGSFDITLRNSEEYILILEQEDVTCTMKSDPVSVIVPGPMTAQIGQVTESLPDRYTGSFEVIKFGGGIPGYMTQIELDSAAVPGQSFSTNYEEVKVNNNFEYEMLYEDIPAGRYLVEVTDSLGCILELVARVPLNTDVFVPNIFTPNGDALNPTFYVRNIPSDVEAELVITNRWGNIIYQTDNYRNDWEAEDTPDGVYFYKLDIDGELYTGWVEVIRGHP